MTPLAAKVKARERRRRGERKRIRGAAGRPRLAVFRSNRHIYAQVVDDVGRRTLAAASTMDPQLRGQSARGGNRAAASEVGKLIGQRALAAGVTTVVFDRAGYLYHGRVAAVADGAREVGLKL